MKPTEGLNIDLKIMQAADIDTAMGSEKRDSKRGESLLLFSVRRARESVMKRVSGTFMAAIVRVWIRAGRKSGLEYVYLKFSSPFQGILYVLYPYRAHSSLLLEPIGIWRRRRRKEISVSSSLPLHL